MEQSSVAASLTGSQGPLCAITTAVNTDAIYQYTQCLPIPLRSYVLAGHRSEEDGRQPMRTAIFGKRLDRSTRMLPEARPQPHARRQGLCVIPLLRHLTHDSLQPNRPEATDDWSAKAKCLGDIEAQSLH